MEKNTDMKKLPGTDYLAPASDIYTICPEGHLCQSFVGNPDSPSEGYGFVDLGEI